MGQYFAIVNLDKREWFSPEDFDENMKAPWLCPRTMRAVGEMVSTSQFPDGGVAVTEATEDAPESREKFGPEPSGRWCGDRIAFIGDYSRDEFEVDGRRMAGRYIYELLSVERDERWANVAALVGGVDSRGEDG